MTNDNEKDDAIESALKAVPDGPLHIAQELRQMADAEPPYTRFTYMSPMVKNVWRAAADFLEQSHRGAKH